MPAPGRLFSDTELTDDSPVSGNVGFVEVIEQTPTLTNEGDECTLGGEIFPECFQVIRKMVDPLGEQSDLRFSGAGIGFGLPVFFEELLF